LLIIFCEFYTMIAAIRVVTHPDGVTTSSYKYLQTSAHITLMAFIMKHIKSSDQNNFMNKQNKVIKSSFPVLTRFIPNISKLDLLNLLEDFCNRTLSTKRLDQNGEIEDFEATTFISAYSYNRNNKQIIIEVSYRLIPFILYIKQQYIGGRWKYSASFTSSYSNLIYDMIITNYDKNTSSLKFNLTEIKEMLGIESGTYEIYSNFKRKVLNIALHEINLKSDICIDLVEHKVNRKVMFIEFLFRKNNNA
jgi:plasmid replication initiation protein